MRFLVGARMTGIAETVAPSVARVDDTTLVTVFVTVPRVFETVPRIPPRVFVNRLVVVPRVDPTVFNKGSTLRLTPTFAVVVTPVFVEVLVVFVVVVG